MSETSFFSWITGRFLQERRRERRRKGERERDPHLLVSVPRVVSLSVTLATGILLIF